MDKQTLVLEPRYSADCLSWGKYVVQLDFTQEMYALPSTSEPRYVKAKCYSVGSLPDTLVPLPTVVDNAAILTTVVYAVDPTLRAMCIRLPVAFDAGNAYCSLRWSRVVKGITFISVPVLYDGVRTIWVAKPAGVRCTNITVTVRYRKPTWEQRMRGALEDL